MTVLFLLAWLPLNEALLAVVVLLFTPFFRGRMAVSWEVRPTGYLIHGRRKQRAVL